MLGRWKKLATSSRGLQITKEIATNTNESNIDLKTNESRLCMDTDKNDMGKGFYIVFIDDFRKQH